MYTIYIAFQAKKDIALLIKNGGKTVTKKIERILHNFINHPKTGIGMVEQLKGDKRGLWSRRIDKITVSFILLMRISSRLKSSLQ